MPRPNPYADLLADLGPSPVAAAPRVRAGGSAYADLLADLDAPEPESGGSLFDTISDYATVPTAVRLGGPIAGGIAGAKAGAGIGTLFAPGPGTAIGATLGGLVGAGLAGAGSEYAAEKMEGVENVDPGEILLAGGLSASP
jgi:hypothetical protein